MQIDGWDLLVVEAGVDLNLRLSYVAVNFRLDAVKDLALVILGFLARIVPFAIDLSFRLLMQVE